MPLLGAVKVFEINVTETITRELYLSKQNKWRRQRLLQLQHFDTLAVLSSAYIQLPLYFPVLKTISNDAKYRNGDFHVKLSLQLCFGVQDICCIVNNTTYIWVIFCSTTDKIIIRRNSYFLLSISGIRSRAALQRQNGCSLHRRCKLSRYVLHLQFYWTLAPCLSRSTSG